MRAIRTAATLALVASTSLAVTACSSSDPLSTASSDTDSEAPSSITIGSADFAESQLIAQIYSLGLQKAGVEVDEKFNIGSREVYMQALQDGSIDLVPEYSGSLLTFLDKSASASDTQSVLDQLGSVLPDGFSLLDAAPAEDRDAIAVTKKFADDNSVTSISDLLPLASSISLGGPSEWKERHDGLLGLQEVYGLQFKQFETLDAGGPLTLSALSGGQIQAGDMFTSDPSIEDNGLVALSDDKNLFPAANVVPVIRESAATDTVSQALNAISAKLTTEELVVMNRKVNAGDDITFVAQDWLDDQGL